MGWQVTSPSHHTNSDGTGVGQIQWVDSDSGQTVLADVSLGPDDGAGVVIVVHGASIQDAGSDV